MKQSQLPGHEHGEAAEIAACCYSAQSPSNNQSCTSRQAEAGVTRRTGDKSRHRIGSHSDFFKVHHEPNHSRQVWERSEFTTPSAMAGTIVSTPQNHWVLGHALCWGRPHLHLTHFAGPTRKIILI